VGHHRCYQSHYGYNTSRTVLFSKTYGEETLRCLYKDYSSLNRWQANWQGHSLGSSPPRQHACVVAAHTAGPWWSLACWRACLTVTLHCAQARPIEHGFMLVVPPPERCAIIKDGTWCPAAAQWFGVEPSPCSEGLEHPSAMVWLRSLQEIY
jgi:hypothetical protein